MHQVSGERIAFGLMAVFLAAAIIGGIVILFSPKAPRTSIHAVAQAKQDSLKKVYREIEAAKIKNPAAEVGKSSPKDEGVSPAEMIHLQKLKRDGR